jgi:type II secretory pathway component GspD/PulD (secretin)
MFVAMGMLGSIVITAPPRIMRMVMDIVDKLDIRRPQVLVEAIIAEVDVDNPTGELLPGGVS